MRFLSRFKKVEVLDLDAILLGRVVGVHNGVPFIAVKITRNDTSTVLELLSGPEIKRLYWIGE